MSEELLFEYLKKNLSVRVQDASEPSTCGGEVEGSLGVRIQLVLKNPAGEEEIISDDNCFIG